MVMVNGCKGGHIKKCSIFIWQKSILNCCAKLYKIKENKSIKNKTGRHQSQDCQEVHLQTQLHFQRHLHPHRLKGHPKVFEIVLKVLSLPPIHLFFS